MKNQALTLIDDLFEQWLNQWQFACRKGCADCCTQNVTMTSLEGERIYRYIRQEKREERFVEILKSVDLPGLPGQTPNEFAACCFNNETPPSPQQSFSRACPFLVNRICSIYEVRPFNCRCFVSTEKCGPDSPAAAPDFIFSSATVVMQLIEHLDQKGMWGNMLDILRCQIPGFSGNKLIQSRIRACRPVPGLLIPPEDADRVNPLLESIFTARIGPKNLQDILNGQ